MPEIKQPEQLSLSLEDNRLVPDELTVEKLRRAIDLLRVNVPNLDAVFVARAPQPLGRPGQRVNPVLALHRYLPGGIVEIYAGAQPENP